jgi:hypothetical protein
MVLRELVGAPHRGTLVVPVLVEGLEAARMLVPGQTDAEPMVVGGALPARKGRTARAEGAVEFCPFMLIVPRLWV